MDSVIVSMADRDFTIPSNIIPLFFGLPLGRRGSISTSARLRCHPTGWVVYGLWPITPPFISTLFFLFAYMIKTQ
jgi:hypothetical protein